MKDGFVKFSIFGLEFLLWYFDWHYFLACNIPHEKQCWEYRRGLHGSIKSLVYWCFQHFNLWQFADNLFKHESQNWSYLVYFGLHGSFCLLLSSQLWICQSIRLYLCLLSLLISLLSSFDFHVFSSPWCFPWF